MTTFLKDLMRVLLFVSMFFVGSFAQADSDCAEEMSSRLKFLQGITSLGLESEENMVYSPASMDGLFALIGPGYNESVQGSLTAYLGEPLAAVASRMAAMSEVTEGIRVTSAMNIFIDQQFQPSVKQPYIEYVAELYGFEPSVLDFGNADATAQSVNSWAAENTKNDDGESLIEEVITPDFVTADMVMILTNALYFKGEWASMFDESMTHESEFQKSDGQTVQTDMMAKYGEEISMSYHPVAELSQEGEEGVVAVELPFKGGKYSFVAAMSGRRTVSEPSSEFDPHTTEFAYNPHMSAADVLNDYMSNGKLVDPQQK
ncbi:MAG: serpin family protein, partial [Pseudomonadota bacterium]